MFFAEADSNNIIDIIVYIVIFGIAIVGNIFKAIKQARQKREMESKGQREISQETPQWEQPQSDYPETDPAMRELMEALGMKPEDSKPVMENYEPEPIVQYIEEEEEGQCSPASLTHVNFEKLYTPSIPTVTEDEMKLALKMEAAENQISQTRTKFVFNKSRLRDAVILKEILDPPMALRP